MELPGEEPAGLRTLQHQEQSVLRGHFDSCKALDQNTAGSTLETWLSHRQMNQLSAWKYQCL